MKSYSDLSVGDKVRVTDTGSSKFGKTLEIVELPAKFYGQLREPVTLADGPYRGDFLKGEYEVIE